MADPMIRPLPLTIAVGLAVAAPFLALVPADYRLWNYAAFGAVGLFAAARAGRLGLPLGLLLALAAKLASDSLNYVQRGYDPDYLPFTDPAYGVAVYAGLAAYAALGWAAARRTANPLRVGATALGGSAVFFGVTNFVSWLSPLNGYPQTADGLVTAYWMGLPFWRGTVLSDVSFTALLFGLNAALAWASAPRPAAVPVEHTPRG